ncbi:MAG: heme A synthase [Gemmatimonadetes bacterium]|nr:MAG: heme A synthase [Gemmatimonadota bacterium]
MSTTHHHRGFLITVAWTLALLFLGSVVHATESSLACPDWPTCHGTMMPEMSGGVFWEHLHRLVAGGLVLIFIATLVVGWKPMADRPALRRWGLAGVGLLVVQSVFGGLTVLYRLPDAVSTTHLTLAFLFLTLATVLAVATDPRLGERTPLDRGSVRLAVVAAGATFVQSVLGAAVRHTDAGLVCPDVPTCLGRWVPPLETATVTLHFAHRVTALVVVALVAALAWHVVRRHAPAADRMLAVAALGAVLLQVGLGVLSVTSRLAVPPVSLHTLVAALLLTLLVTISARSWRRMPEEAPQVSTPSAAGAHGG